MGTPLLFVSGILVIQISNALVVFVIMFQNNNKFEPSESKLQKILMRTKLNKIRDFFTKTCQSIHTESLSVGSVKRSALKVCRSIRIRSRHHGYEKFYTDEEKRCFSTVINCSNYVVEAL